MPKGTEVTMALLIKAIHDDAGLQTLFFPDGSQGGEVQVHRDEVPAIITYPFIFLSEATESQDLRDSESLQDSPPISGPAPPNPTHLEFKRVHCIAFAAGGDLPWAIVQRVRQLLVDGNNQTPYFQPDATQNSEDVYSINALTESQQNLLPTLIKDELARKIYQSTQTFLLYAKKLGGV